MLQWKRARAFTFVELMIVVAILSILSGLGIPPLISWLRNKDVRIVARNMYSDMRRAQMQAVKLRKHCTILFNGTEGYVVFVDKNKSFNLDEGDQLLYSVHFSKYPNAKVKKNSITFKLNSAGRRAITFRPDMLPLAPGSSLGNGSISFESTVDNSAPIATVAINVSGNISLQWSN